MFLSAYSVLTCRSDGLYDGSKAILCTCFSPTHTSRETDKLFKLRINGLHSNEADRHMNLTRSTYLSLPLTHTLSAPTISQSASPPRILSSRCHSAFTFSNLALSLFKHLFLLLSLSLPFFFCWLCSHGDSDENHTHTFKSKRRLYRLSICFCCQV